ncbi:MATE family efflux transporter [Aquisalibacillus elongatus]|uniref:Probable multidrug resistance protein NorM n=1 Tax=Aquisalibacillus elongatus TaxID=485577 RepID=A0A3N5AYJ0_9BACI|nr:MATE family efflux transporter [Aquisalibacillus elongatus]RPF50114.1 MATE family multidrug resistance protein [Aquisalibacillus elongatus]
MYETQSISEKMSLFIKILIPILITQVGLYLMNFFDTVMAGRAGAQELAGVAIGSSLWVPILTGVIGILMAIPPIVSQLLGAKQGEQITHVVRQGVYLAIMIAIAIFIIGLIFLTPLLNALSLEPGVSHVAKYYLVSLGFGMIPLFVFNLLRSFIDALGQTKISMLIILLALPLNVFFNYIFIFGNWGAPEYGGIGAGIASAVTYFITSIIVLLIIQKKKPFNQYEIFSSIEKPELKAWLEQLKIGIPIGITIFFETSIFAAITLFMSTYDTETIAAHQSAINFASIFYMLPLAIAMALTIAVGFEVGARRYNEAVTYAKLGIGSGVVTSAIAGVLIFIFREDVASLYSNDPVVIGLMQHFLIYAVFFQLSDGIGTPIQGALRGYKDVNITSVIALISFWVLGLPSGYLAANFTDLGPYGYWVGLITGLGVGALALSVRLIYVTKKKYV